MFKETLEKNFGVQKLDLYLKQTITKQQPDRKISALQYNLLKNIW